MRHALALVHRENSNVACVKLLVGENSVGENLVGENSYVACVKLSFCLAVELGCLISQEQAGRHAYRAALYRVFILGAPAPRLALSVKVRQKRVVADENMCRLRQKVK